VSKILRSISHITGHFGDKSLQAITCTVTSNLKQTAENTGAPKKHTE